MKLSLETRTDVVSRDPKGSAGDLCSRIEAHLQKLDLSISGVPLDDALFARLGERGASAKRMFSPTGTADFGYKFTREEQDASMLNGLAWACATHDLYLGDAIKAAERAVSLEPKNVDILDTLAELYFRQGNTTKAVA